MTRTLMLALLVPAAFALSAATAQAAGETISPTQNDPAVVGRATNFTAAGALNPDDTMFGFDIFVFVKDADGDPTCAADFDKVVCRVTAANAAGSTAAASRAFRAR